ncbi:MATE family efflux transporter [Membranihabitans marinus]|uniref:MATE family efflux transporter n=1 Tax=Membranihabitans marinus TaxID=1227546 RepID=UPI001EFF3C21|nr:MATE family efflux transporter [Membranihabitans marinus]
MGIVKRQSSKQAILQVFGILIGGISVLYIYPLNTEMLGFARFIWDSGLLMSSFILFGANTGMVKYFPVMNSKSGANFSLPFYSIFLVFGIIMFSVIYYFFGDELLKVLNKNNIAFLEYNGYFFISAILTSIIIFLNYYCNTLKRIVIPFIASNFIKKVALPVLILAFVWGHISKLGFANYLIITLVLAILLQVVYIYRLNSWRIGKVDWDFLGREWKPILTYSLVSMFGIIGTSFAFQIDSFMISTLIGYDSNGIYSIGFFIANMVYLPYMALSTIMSPIISNNISLNNWSKIGEYYKQGGNIMLTIGIPVFLLGYFCVSDLQDIFPSNKDFEVLEIIILLIGLTKLFDLATSFNTQIMVYSDLYKINLKLILVMAVLNVLMNYVFIVFLNMDIVGVALASTISISLFNIVKLVLLNRRFGIHPFTQKTLSLLILAALLFFLLLFIPSAGNPYLSIFLKTLLVGSIYAGIVYLFHLSPEVEKYGMELLNKLKIK